MPKPSIFTLGILLMLAALIAVPAFADDKVDPDYATGQAEATKDLTAGKHRYVFLLPEAFWMEFQDGDDSNLMDYYTAVVADKYGVTNEVVLVIPGPAKATCHDRGCDNVVDAEIDKKFGADTLDYWRRRDASGRESNCQLLGSPCRELNNVGRGSATP